MNHANVGYGEFAFQTDIYYVFDFECGVECTTENLCHSENYFVDCTKFYYDLVMT